MVEQRVKMYGRQIKHKGNRTETKNPTYTTQVKKKKER